MILFPIGLTKEMVKIYPLIECDDQEINEFRDLISEHRTDRLQAG